MEEAEEDQRRRLKLEEALEIQSLRRIISAYLNYPDAAEEDVRRNERSYRKLPPSHKLFLACVFLSLSKMDTLWPIQTVWIEILEALLSQYPQKFQRLRWCISMNTHFIFSMLQAFEPPLDMSQDADFSEDPHPESAQKDHLVSEGISACSCESAPVRITCSVPDTSSQQQWLAPSLKLNVPLVDADKVRCIIRNIVRDWAAEGKKERDQCYNPILEELNMLFPNRSKESPPACLVPGAGLGRLALEISCLGFISQGNEFSYYMMICSSFILNHNCNSLSDSDQLRPVSIPDIHPASAGITEGFSMCGGAWDAVVTCFFIDTAHNIVEYIEIISKILKDGGFIVGDIDIMTGLDKFGTSTLSLCRYEMSIELSLEDVKRVAFHYGFEFENERTIETTYTANSRSMMQNRYFAAFWTMRKKSAAVQQQVP
ncbi:hypothetical protein JHK84_035324 [Glycine max]|nr:hypothetical protein JHK84_035324 [Glycine max]